jgi:SAM-dependent methyltransferase
MTHEVFAHFGARARDYARRSQGWPWSVLRRREAKAVLSLVDPHPGERILDAGCGAGHYARLLRERGARVLGIDGSPEMVAAARTQGIEAEQFDLACGPPPGGPFAKILCAGALEFCPDPARVVAHLIGALESGGSLVILVPRLSVLGRLYRRHHRRHGLAIHLFTRAELERIPLVGARLTGLRRVAFSWVARIERADPQGRNPEPRDSTG